jgi:hypothetical protein
MAPHTVFLARLIGLFLLIVSIAEMIHKSDMIETASELAHAPPLLFITGLFMLVAGLAMVLSHNVWSGGALNVVITVIGWIILIRGVVLVFISPGGAAGLYEALNFEKLFYLYVAVPLLLGIYLTYAGFTADDR